MTRRKSCETIGSTIAELHKSLTGAMVIVCMLAACTPDDDFEQHPCGSAECNVPRAVVDIQSALEQVYSGKDTYSDVQSGRVTPLTALRASPEQAVKAWNQAYKNTLPSDTATRSALLYLAGDACLDELVDDIAGLAEDELTTESLAVDLCREEALPPGRVAGFAARALGKMTREQCSRLGANDANIRAATDHLFGWVQTGTRGMHTTAAEQLLIFQPAAAAALKRQLPGERASLLEPIESRKTEPFVEDSGPEPHSPATRARALECDPEEDHAPICEAPFNYDRGRDGDLFIQEAIAFNASFLDGEDCSALAARYDREIDLENGTWDDGYGINDPCNATKPFARTVNALWLLENSSDNNPPGDYSGGVIHWGYDYFKNISPEVEASCSGEAMAIAVTGFWCDVALVFCDERIELMANYHEMSAPVRAAVLMHEARHIAGYDHVADADCPRNGSCDSRYSYRGANTISVQWLAQFVRTGRHKTDFMKEDSLSYANHVLGRRYRTCPELLLSPDGDFYSAGPTACE